ncbi:Receptor-like protein EIX2 [Heracleum sosnowskyi]|uniref:Receptor-like protein EIX2 n=1 Tax=Heracleum sosnowskyi TaxID=360622 RepID=A0AAD8HD48_9APIA|nr:Receptor-like protein EIX2 [Heracleum sosnowskyi]
MTNTIYSLHVLVVVIFLLCMKTLSFGSESLSKNDKTVRCIEMERKALLVFKQGVISGTQRQDLLSSWKNEEEEDCCKWKGISCDDHTGHVTHLDISYPATPPYMFGRDVSISHSLLDLSYLNYLDLSGTFFGDLSIPKFIGSLTRLVHLDLSHTYIRGSIPYQFENLTNLQYLNLSHNSLSGPVPKFIGSLSSLRYLDLSSNQFSGDFPQELENLFKLQHLDLGNNFLTSENFEWLFNLHALVYLDFSYVSIPNPSVWVSFIQRIPNISVMHLNYCNLSAPSSTLSNFSTSISALHLQGNHINSSIFYWLSHLNGSLEVLDLSYNMLAGRIPQSFGHMTAITHLNLGQNLLNGPIPVSFALMTALTYLDLSANQLNGLLPESFSNLSSLQVADLSSNNLTGNLEDILFGPLALLQELSVSENQLTGSLPDITLLSSLKKLQASSNKLNGYLPTAFENYSAIVFLDLSNNHLRGSLPDFTRFSSLESLYLHSNEFSGSLPDFTGCSSLRELRLGENRLTEWETQSIGLLSNLIELDLSMNSIRSTILEAHLSNLSSLEYMRTSFNSLTFEFSSEWLPPFQLRELYLASCKLGPKFPNWIQNQEYIDHLDISNSQISDIIPLWFWNISSSLLLLNLSSNQISGKFSWKYGHITEIDLSSNLFDGPLPPIPTKCSKMNLSGNKFSGTLLSLSVVKDISIRFLDISHNQLFGTLPDNWMYFQGLVFLNLGYNNFSGTIPKSIGHLVSLETLILRNNMLYGELPASLRNCSNLGFVDFGLNKLSGKVPSWIGEDLAHLYALILKSNRFYGSIPYETCHLSNLHFLDLSINRIFGTIPPCFSNFTAMTQKGSEAAEHMYSSTNLYTDSVIPSEFPSAPAEAQSPSYNYYYDDVIARWKGQEFEYGRNFAYLKMIDLSSNELTGEIPTAITRLLELKGLNLSGNGLSGNVPLEIGQLKVLESLDLSTNKFTGEIPLSMSGLNFLAFLNLSNNNFLGRIPSGTQLQGFGISTYDGNTGLCGKPLTSICPGDEPADHVQPSFEEYEVDGDDSEYERWLYISVVLGFSTTFWGFIGTLVLSSRWRHAYFLFLDNLKERFCVWMAMHIRRFPRDG